MDKKVDPNKVPHCVVSKGCLRCEKCGESVPFPLGAVEWVFGYMEAFISGHASCDGPAKGGVGHTDFKFRDWDVALAAADTALFKAAKAWMDWMDSDGDGTDKTVDDEAAMLSDLRKAVETYSRAALVASTNTAA